MNPDGNNIAAAKLAQLFGSELLRIQQNAKTDSGSVPDVVKLDPKSFLVSQPSRPHQPTQQNSAAIMDALQREAEASCPLPVQEVSVHSHQTVPMPSPVVTSATVLAPQPVEPVKHGVIIESSIAERIASSLEKIALILETQKTNNDTDS